MSPAFRIRMMHRGEGDVSVTSTPDPDPLRLVAVEAGDGHRIWLRYADGAEGEVDFCHLVGKGVFAAWRDPDFFAGVHIGAGDGIAWSEENDPFWRSPDSSESSSASTSRTTILRTFTRATATPRQPSAFAAPNFCTAGCGLGRSASWSSGWPSIRTSCWSSGSGLGARRRSGRSRRSIDGRVTARVSR